MIVGVGLFTDISEECNLWDVPRNNYVGRRFRCHDLLSTTETPLDILLAVAPKANGAKFVHAGSVLHTFESEDDILVVCRRVYQLRVPGGCFFGTNRPVGWIFGKSYQLKACLEHLGFVNVHVEPRDVILAGREDSNIIVKQGWAPTWFAAYKPSGTKL